MANFKEDLVRVKAFIFDIDGVLSLQTITLNSFGVPNRTVNLRDGYALQLAVKKGYHIDISNVLFMGHDIPDFEVMKEAGVSVCPSDADSEIKQVSSYISDKKGGEGCVRDVIEQVLRLHNNWMDSDAFTW